MDKRRPLVDGIKSPPRADPRREADFVYGKSDPVPPGQPDPASGSAGPPAGPAVPERVAARPARLSRLTTRLRPELAAALKRASLERELAGQTPHTVQDILEVALGPWLRENGYLK